MYNKIAILLLLTLPVLLKAQTGNGSADMKLKSLEKTINKMTFTLEEYKSNKNVMENDSGLLVHLGFEVAAQRAEREINDVKKIVPLYNMDSYRNKVAEMKSEYQTLKLNSKQRAIDLKNKKEQLAYERSPEYYIKMERFKEKPQEGYTSEFHKQKVGEIVFSKSMITRMNPGAALQTDFNATDRIYGRWFSDKALINQTLYNSKGDSTRIGGKSMAPYYLIYVDGVLQDFRFDNSYISNKSVEETTRQLWLHPLVEDDYTDIKWVRTIKKLTPGKHNIKVEFYAFETENGEEYKKLVAKGEFNLIKKAGDEIKIGKSWADFQSGMNSNTQLLASILKLVQGDATILNDGEKKVAVKIVSTDWKVTSNNISGVPMYRWITVQVKIVDANGYCRTDVAGIRQDYLGNGKYDSKVLFVTFLDVPGYSGYIDCN